MQDTESARTGYTKLYHPRGPLVSLPVVGDTPKAMFDYVTACLDAGFVVTVPGIEEGEEKEMVSGVLRGEFEREGEVTPTLLLYAADEGHKYSFLKIYLNSDEDVKTFEAACGVKMDNLPIYDGKDKPERDGGKIATKYIVRLPKHVPVLFKQNPKWSADESAKAIAAQKPYTVPKRVFVRWADAPVNVTPAPANLPHAEPLSEIQVAEAAWKARLAKVIGKDDMNKLVPDVKAIASEAVRARAWTMCVEFAKERKWVFDVPTRLFKDVAELPPVAKTVDVDAIMNVIAPPVPKPALPPPPDMDPPDGVHPLIAEWKKKLDPITVNLEKLNGEVLSAFKAIVKSNPLRAEVWAMLAEFAQANGCQYDRDAMKFVEVDKAGVP